MSKRIRQPGPTHINKLIRQIRQPLSIEATKKCEDILMGT